MGCTSMYDVNYFLPAVHMSADGDVQRGDWRLHLRAQRHRRAGQRVLPMRGEHLRLRLHHRLPGVRLPGRGHRRRQHVLQPGDRAVLLRAERRGTHLRHLGGGYSWPG